MGAGKSGGQGLNLRTPQSGRKSENGQEGSCKEVIFGVRGILTHGRDLTHGIDWGN
jgi:hypothetical protein